MAGAVTLLSLFGLLELDSVEAGFFSVEVLASDLAVAPSFSLFDVCSLELAVDEEPLWSVL